MSVDVCQVHFIQYEYKWCLNLFASEAGATNSSWIYGVLTEVKSNVEGMFEIWKISFLLKQISHSFHVFLSLQYLSHRWLIRLPHLWSCLFWTSFIPLQMLNWSLLFHRTLLCLKRSAFSKWMSLVSSLHGRARERFGLLSNYVACFLFLMTLIPHKFCLAYFSCTICFLLRKARFWNALLSTAYGAPYQR